MKVPSGFFSLKTCPKVFSTKDDAPPISAVIHIQNTAPGPPMDTAAATPTMLPVPMWDAAEIVNALKGEIEFSSFAGVAINFIAWLIFDICPPLILNV